MAGNDGKEEEVPPPPAPYSAASEINATELDTGLTAEEEPEDLFADYESPAEEEAEEAAPTAARDVQKFLDLEAADDGDEDLEAELGKVIDEEMDAELEKMLDQAEVDEEVREEQVPTPQKATASIAKSPTPQKSSQQAASSTVPSPAKVPASQQASQQAQPTPSSAKKSPQKDGFVDESRFMRDQNGVLLHKWKVDYAPRGGGGRAQCRDSDCLERHQQAGVKTIEKGQMRIGRRVLVEKDGSEGQVHIMWYHARCIFNQFLRSRKDTRRIESPEDIEGFDAIQPEDQETLRKIIAGNQDVKGARFRSSDGSRPETPQQKRGPADLDTPGFKRRKEEEPVNPIELKKGHRIWAHCRVRPKQDPRPDAPPPAVFAVKSEKPELGLIVEEEADGSFIIQFESKEHEKERLNLFKNPKKKRLRAYLRYPRLFEGSKQRIPRNWIVKSRLPPRLCSCTKQKWSHECPCGISCGRGAQMAVWGIGD